MLQPGRGRALTTLLHLRKGELRPAAGTVWPALHHRLVARIETHAFRTVGMVVAEQAALPAAEAVEGHRHRQRHVHAYHADLDLAHELARHAAVAGEDGDAV